MTYKVDFLNSVNVTCTRKNKSVMAQSSNGVNSLSVSRQQNR